MEQSLTLKLVSYNEVLWKVYLKKKLAGKFWQNSSHLPNLSNFSVNFYRHYAKTTVTTCQTSEISLHLKLCLQTQF